MNENTQDWQSSWTPIQVDPLLDPQLLEERELHAEPFWMQDVRIALRRLEASRLAARSTPEDQAASGS
jgi:hypothetical protein